jgi:hypothetical protein
MAGPHAELHATAGEMVEVGVLRRQQGRVAKVVVDHERPDPECRRGLGHRE